MGRRHARIAARYRQRVLTIADRNMGVCCPPELAELLDRAPYRTFRIAGATPQAHLLIRPVRREEWLDAIRRPPDTQSSISAEMRIMRTTQLKRRIERRGATELLAPQDTRVDFYEPGSATLESHGYDYGNPRRFMEGRIMRLLATTLVRGNGLLVHGAGVVIDGCAVAMVGPSGAGKTTAARFVHADSLLSDDIVAVSECDGCPRLHGTPLGRETDGPLHAPLGAVFFPRKADSFSLTPLPHRQALARAIAEQHDCLDLLFEPYVGEAFRHYYRLLRHVPAYELAFSLDGGIDCAAVRELLNRGESRRAR